MVERKTGNVILRRLLEEEKQHTQKHENALAAALVEDSVIERHMLAGSA